MAQERYAVESRYVLEVQPLRILTRLPSTPPIISGIVNIRGRILPVLDLKKFLQLPEEGITDLHFVILVRGEDFEIGILADVIAGIRFIADHDLQRSLPTLSDVRSEYLKGVTAERLVVLNLRRILMDPRILVQDEVKSGS